MATNSANWMRYGPIKLNIVKLLEYKKEPVYSDKDKTHYMYTRHTIAVGATVYPDTDIDYTQIPQQVVQSINGCYTQELSEGNALTSPQKENTTQPVVRIDALLRHFLMQPRQKFKYVIGDNILIEVPTLDAITDCNNGPKPVSLNIKRVGGLQSMYVEYVITTDLNESIRHGSAEYPILSNHYSMEHEVNQDFYTTRKVSGVAHFRSDLLYRDGLSPDDFREWLNIPSPKGFKRDVVRCRVHPDALKMEYSFIDREMHHHLDTRDPAKKGKNGKYKVNGVDVDAPDMRDITRLEVKHGLHVQTESITAMLGKAGNMGMSLLTGKKGNARATIGAGVKDIASSLLPIKTEFLEIVVYGNNKCEKHEMEYLALFIIEKRLPFSQLASLYTFSVEEDVLGSHIRMRVTRVSSLIEPVGVIAGAMSSDTLNNVVLKPLGSGLFNLPQIKKNKNTFFPEAQGIGGVTVKTFIDKEKNPELDNLDSIKVRDGKYDQMRGTYLEQLVSEGIRLTPDEPPVDDKSTPFFEYSNGNEYEKKLPIFKKGD